MTLEEESREYELTLHWKQGDDFRGYLSKSETVSEALVKWADHFESCRDRCLALSEKFRGRDIEAEAGANTVCFFGDERVLNKTVKEKLLDVLVPIDSTNERQ